MESSETCGAIAFTEMAKEFVVGLPADDVRIILEMPCHGTRDADGFFLKSRVVGAAVLAAAMNHGPSAFIDAHPVRVISGQPERWSGRGGAENGLDAVTTEKSYGSVKE